MWPFSILDWISEVAFIYTGLDQLCGLSLYWTGSVRWPSSILDWISEVAFLYTELDQ